ncbi:capsular associated protein [Mortierella alpina]|nr:capsular associated protein [Mortierella alpina]
MAVSYTPLNQHPSPTASRRGSGDLESSHADDCSAEKPFRMSLRQRQLVGLLAFLWLLCLYVALKFMEASQASHHSPLLLSTNALLQTTDLYHTLTLPLLQLSNRTELISSRCGSNTLAPHLLSFLSNNLECDLHSQGSDVSDPTPAATRQWSTEKYLIAMVVKDSETILPDLLTRVMETISILGPEHCHLSIVNHVSADNTQTVLDLFIAFLESYNQGAFLEPVADGKQRLGVTEQMPKTSRRQGHISYTIRTLSANDTSSENAATIKNLALEPLLNPAATTLSATYSGSVKINSDSSVQAIDPKAQEKPRFDSVILLEPVVTCAEDILELVFQSRLQNADLTCGMDLRLEGKASDSKLLPGIKREEAYDNSATRDILGHRPHSDVDHRDVFSTDPETQTRFEKRLPFQVQSCWSSAVVLRLSPVVVSALPFSTGDPARPEEPSSELDSVQEPGQETSHHCSLPDERMLLSDELWKQHQVQQRTPGTSAAAELPSLHDVAKVVVVPAVHFASSAQEYKHQGRFDGWGLWPSTAQQYRDALEAKFVAMGRHPLYGYRPSTASYGYIPRVKEEKVQVETDTAVEGESSEVLEGTGVEHGNGDDEVMSRLLIPEEVLPLLKARLEDINAVFGVQDIEDAVLTKQEAELIAEWRDRSRQGAEC